MMIEKRDTCPDCGKTLAQAEYDGQYCSSCATTMGFERQAGKLLAAAGQATAAAADMIECARDGAWDARDNVGSGDTLSLLVDACRLLIEATGRKPADNLLHGALSRWLEEKEGYVAEAAQ